MPILHFAGVDFSGARDAGRHVWLCVGAMRDDRLRVSMLSPAAELPDGGVDRERALSALRDDLAARADTLVGLDFPPGLPRAAMRHGNWREMVRHFAGDYPDADVFREMCKSAADGREIRRQTDIETATPFCVYNLRLYRQTYYGLRDVIAPLVQNDSARVIPMQNPEPGKVMLAESCPASTLKALDLYAPYKGNGDAMLTARRYILDTIARQYPVDIPEQCYVHMVQNPGGDALDAFLAMFGVWAYVAAGRPLLPEGDQYAIEGYVYMPRVDTI